MNPNPASPVRTVDLGATVTGVRLPFCAMNAAGSAATAEELRALARSHTGAIVLKTATVHPFLHPQFRSLHNPGFDKLLPLVRDLAADGRRPVVASVAGATAEEFGFLAKAFADAGAAAIEGNLADEWVDAMLAPLETPSVLAAIATRLAAASETPVWVKLPRREPLPYRDIVDILVDAGVRAVVIKNDFGGLERLFLEATQAIEAIAVGGIASGYEVSRAIQKGAKAVQVGSALRTEGPSVFARLEREMRKALGER